MKMISISYNLCRLPVKKEFCASTKTFIKHLSTSLNEEYSPEPQYPPILDLSLKARKLRKVESWHDKIKNLATIEEKMIEVNMPKYYGWSCYMQREDLVAYNSLNYAQHVTRTHFINDLPAYYKSQQLEDAAKEYLNEVKSQFVEALLFELQRELPIQTKEDVEPHEIETVRSQAIVEQLNNVLTTCLSRHLPHLQEAFVDPSPRVEAFWVAGGMEPPTRTIKVLEKLDHTKDTAYNPRDRHIQYLGNPLLHLRSELPLSPILSAAECESPELTVPVFTYDPRVLGTKVERRHGTNIPGFWPGDKHQFGLLSYHTKAHLGNRPEVYGPEEHLEALHCQAIFASYGWLLPQACNLGFSTFNDLTYPLMSQTVITDGQLWSLYAYQMNTTLVHSHHVKENPKKNVCWGSQPLKLFEGTQDGKLVGLNEDVLKAILKMYINAPAERKGVEMRPYLNASCPTVSEIEDPERRRFLEKLFKYLSSNRPRHFLGPEYYHWETIYKIKFKTRPMDARRRPFELWQNPWARRLNETKPPYLPKALRTDDMKQKYEKTFYP